MNHDPVHDVIVESAGTEELAPALRLIFSHLPPQDREARLANALELLRQGELNPAGVLVARGPKKIPGAILCQATPGAAGLIWPPQTARGTQNRLQVEDQLVQSASRWLRQSGVKLGQALLSADDASQASPLERNGFTHITTLGYMKHDLDLPVEVIAAGDQLGYQTYAEGDPHIFHQTLLRTYEQTLDCPEVNGVRDVAEIIDGHRGQGLYEPTRWWLAWQGGLPVGVLLVTEVPETRGWDLAYLGIVSEVRRRGLGRKLARKALLEAHKAKAGQLTLAVDRRNRPAWDLYRGLGFEIFDQREVYLAIWPLL